jgi:Putative peptidoglycan binding domain
MGKVLISATVLGLGLALAAPAAAQNYQSQPRYDSYGSSGSSRDRDSRDRDYRDRDSRDSRDQSGRQDRSRDSALNLDVESALQARGYNVGTVDGSIDAQSRAGIRAYQRDAGLDPNGQPSTQLLNHIETNNLRAGGAASGQTDLGAAAGQALQQLLNKR